LPTCISLDRENTPYKDFKWIDYSISKKQNVNMHTNMHTLEHSRRLNGTKHKGKEWSSAGSKRLEKSPHPGASTSASKAKSLRSARIAVRQPTREQGAISTMRPHATHAVH
jgi:hypothetical protein